LILGHGCGEQPFVRKYPQTARTGVHRNLESANTDGRNGRPASQRSALTLQETHLALRWLAAFHANFWQAPQAESPDTAGIDEVSAQLWPQGLFCTVNVQMMGVLQPWLPAEHSEAAATVNQSRLHPRERRTITY
jgi:hypothetical protein